MKNNKYLTVLGGGLAGLAVGHYADRANLSALVVEQADRVGGTAMTVRHGPFSFDIGAHFFFDKNPAVTRDMAELLGHQWHLVNLPFQTCHDGVFIDFPLSAVNLWKNLGPAVILRAAGELAVQKLKNRRKKPAGESFEDLALKTYGRSLAEAYFLNHSRKHWGRPCGRLSANISGGKLRPLDLKGLPADLLGLRGSAGRESGVKALYPTGGAGRIAESLAASCGPSNLITNSRVTRIGHGHGRIRSIEINGRDMFPVREVVSTIPLNHLIGLLDPPAPDDIRDAAQSLSFRDMIQVVLFLDRASATKVASIHFTDLDFPVTRVHEPRNRCQTMSPPGKTSLVAEIPCGRGDSPWTMTDDRLVEMVVSGLARSGLVGQSEVGQGLVQRIGNAYPVLTLGYEKPLGLIMDYLDTFTNLHLTGRCGAYQYISMHHVIESARDTVAGLAASGRARS